MKKYTLGFLILSTMVAATMPVAAETQQPNSILVCRARQCADASFSMTKGFLFNKLAQMFRNNNGKSVLLCEADPVSHVCLNEGITIPAQTSFADTNVTLDGFNLVEEKLLNGQTKMEVVFDYKVRANKTFPKCQLGVSELSVNYLDQVELVSQDVVCNITETGRSSLNLTYNVDYLDFDYGFIGAYYTAGIGEAVRGDKNGYVLMRFTHRAPFEEVPPVEAVPVNNTDKGAGQSGVAPLPEVLPNTAPTPPQKPSDFNLDALPPKSSVQPTKEVVTQDLSVTTTPANAPQTVHSLKPTVIKTTIIEKTVITPDSRRQVAPPETRTILNDGKETMIIR